MRPFPDEVVCVSDMRFLGFIIKGGISVMPRLFMASTFLVCGWVVTAGQQQPIEVGVQTPVPAATAGRRLPEGESDERYRIGPGDLLDIRVFKRPELSRDAVRVDARGMIRMPLIKNEIVAACRTEGELEKEIETSYKKYLLEPQVSVFVKDFQSQPVAVLGAVKAPGRFILQRRLRLLELLSIVGGATDQAGRSIQVVHAEQALSCEGEEGSSPVTKATGMSFYQLSATLQGEGVANPYVQPGDIITIPAAEQALIVGNVLKPSVIPLREPTTLSRAVALAGGVLPETNRERVRIVRQTEGTNTTDIYVNLKAVDKRQADDILLKPNDIIEVRKVTGTAKALRDLLKTVVPTVSQLPIRAIPY
jgi:polysaccharide export outer membrane protein